jgi:hypothetical protein
VNYESIVVVLATGGALLERDALDALEGMSVTWVRVEREGESGCLAARVRHADPADQFRVRIREWGVARGWAVTVAPCGTPH